MKKAFTLIEMMVVVAIIVTLMSIVFKLGAISNQDQARLTTIDRLQRLENCLSGYYAAFGCYPPVSLYASRDINTGMTSDYTKQAAERRQQPVDWENERRAWDQVKAACKAQPIDARFPYPAGAGWNKTVERISRGIAARAASGKEAYRDFWDPPARKIRNTAGFDDGVTNNRGRFDGHKDSISFEELSLFKFGLMSYLLPRYLVMISSAPDEKGQLSVAQFYTDFAQWGVMNGNEPVNPLTGDPLSWQEVVKMAQQLEGQTMLAMIPTQAVCARWIPNLERVCSTEHTWDVFGVNLQGSVSAKSGLSINNPTIEIFQPYGEGNTRDQYVLDYISVADGWGEDFFYYSPTPYQRYTLWSAGKNGKTCPPWVQRDTLSSKANKVISDWVSDDIVSLSH